MAKVESWPVVVSVPKVAGELQTPWGPVDLARANDTVIRMARFDGAFDWHDHDEDELFLCWSGTFRIEMEGHETSGRGLAGASPRPSASKEPDPAEVASIELGPGDIFVVPAFTRHRPVADRGPAYGIMIERPETTQRGSAGRPA